MFIRKDEIQGYRFRRIFPSYPWRISPSVAASSRCYTGVRIEGRAHLFNHVGKHTAVVLVRVAKYLPLLLAVVLFYSIIGTALDIHPSLQRATDCIICQFTDNLSCGDDAAASSLLPSPELLQTALVTDCLSFFSKISLPPIGGRAPPALPPSIVG